MTGYDNIQINSFKKNEGNLFKNKNGVVDFREFLIGLSLIVQPASLENTIKYAFKVKKILIK